MKKIILLLFAIGFSQSINAFTLESMNVSAINTTDINVHVKVSYAYTFDFISSVYTINGNSIILDICCYDTLFNENMILENDYIIPNINTNTTNYTLIVNLHNYSFTVPCENTPILDSGTMTVATPVTQTIYYLTNTTFEKNNLSITPNPNNGSFLLNATENYNVIIYDLLGKVVYFNYYPKENNYIETHLQKGIYVVKIKVENKNIIKKLIVE